MSYAAKCSTAMQTLFQHYGASGALSQIDITKEQFESAMRSAFSQAKALDICYLYCASHGDASGLCLFSGTSVVMTPEYLREQIDSYDGTFVVFVSGCHSGTYISENSIANDGPDSESADFFDADSFVNILTREEYAVEGYGLKSSQRIKVLCSSRKEEVSYSTDLFATYYWCLGSGYDYPNNTFVSIASDSNLDGRVSLEELYEYSHDRVLETLSGGRVQNIVCCPDSDNYIIFESSY